MIPLDIETAGDEDGYALQPWRVREGKARITCVAVGDDLYTDAIIEKLNSLPPSTFVCWNTVFDVAFLYASNMDVKKHKWLDGKLIMKWVLNSQELEDQPKHGGIYSLANAAEKYLKGWKHYEAFIKLKAAKVEPGKNDKYWQVRAKLDVQATELLTKYFLAQLTQAQRRAMMIEAGNIVPAAIAYVNGIPTNPNDYHLGIEPTLKAMHDIEDNMGLRTGDGPSKILRSPKQLKELLYGDWGLTCERYTEKGEPSTDKTALTYLADTDDRVLDILAWRSYNTILTKFLESPKRAYEYLGNSTFHPCPNIFSTYTGRYTYGSKILNKYQIGMALHQMPRGPKVRKMVAVPEDKLLMEVDASGQEAKLLADIGNIDTMLNIFNQGINYHSDTGAGIAGVDYNYFQQQYKAGVPEYAGSHGYRYAGKFINLSSQYRVGARKARLQARVQYGLIESVETVKNWQDVWHSKHPGVKMYWQDAIQRAKYKGYAETLAGRRFYIGKWDEDSRWSSESSAINFPIQGSGGDMKNLAISYIYKTYPEVEFAWDLHDGLFYWIPKTKQGIELALDIRNALDNLDYEKYWGYRPGLKFTWDCSVGSSWANMRELR